MIRDQEPGLTWGWGEPHFVVILLWLVLRTVIQEQADMPAQCSFSADSYHQLTKHIKLRRMNASVRRSAPVPSNLKKKLVYATYERAVTHSFSDGMIPLGSLLLANTEHIFLQFIFPVWFIPRIHLEKHAQHHHNSCTAKSITILIDHGFISCPNTDNKELHTRCTQILSLSFTVSGNDKANPSRTKKPIQKSPKSQMPAWMGFECPPWSPKVRAAHFITCNKLVLGEQHYLQLCFEEPSAITPS